MKRKTKRLEDIQLRKKSKKKKYIIICSVIILFMIGFICYFLFFDEKLQVVEKKKPVKEEKPIKLLTIVDENSNQRPIAIMIDNNVGPSNHVGLQNAYVSYEMIVEGGLTRIMVLFKDSNTDLIGPVRSSRHYFLDYALEHDAIYAHFGFSTYAQKDIQSLGVNNINGLYISDAYWRDRYVAAPHNVFTNIETLYASANHLGYQVTTDQWKVLNYTTDEVNLVDFISKNVTCNDNVECNKNPDLIIANQVIIPYSSQVRSYQYDDNLKTYFRFMNNQPHVDKVSKEQYHYKNIIIQQVENHNLDNEGRQDLTTTGSGKGYYITNGYALPITWHKSSRKSKTVYQYLDGSDVKINDGNTFIQIQPITKDVVFN